MLCLVRCGGGVTVCLVRNGGGVTLCLVRFGEGVISLVLRDGGTRFKVKRRGGMSGAEHDETSIFLTFFEDRFLRQTNNIQYDSKLLVYRISL